MAVCVCVYVSLSELLLNRFAVSLFNEQLSLSFRTLDMYGVYYCKWRKVKTLWQGRLVTGARFPSRRGGCSAVTFDTGARCPS